MAGWVEAKSRVYSVIETRGGALKSTEQSGSTEKSRKTRAES